MKPKRYVVFDLEGPTPFESDYLQECIEFLIMHPSHFVWDRHEQRVVAS